MLGNGKTALADSLDIVTAELEMLIDRHFASRRELVVSNDEGKFWTASIGDNVLYRSPDGRAALRFARTFAERTAGIEVVVDEEWIEPEERFSVRVDNVVPIHEAHEKFLDNVIRS
jgi:hypothetical protein